MREHYQQRDSAAREWKARGGRVVGYLCDNVPEELIMAAGGLPYRVSGSPAADSRCVERYVQPFALPFSAHVERPTFVTSMLELLLRGGYDFLDALVVPHTRKAIQAMYRELRLVAAEYPRVRVPELVYLDRTYTPFYASEMFNRQRLLEFKTWLEQWSGVAMTPDALAEAIAVTNRTRDLLSRLAQLRRAKPPRVSGTDALQVIGASAFMPKPAYNALLEQFLAESDSTKADSGVPSGGTGWTGVRVFVGGSPLDHTRLYALIEECGAMVVAEDHCWGNRLGEFPLDTSLNPFDALSDRYHRKPTCSIGFPLATLTDACAARAAAAEVDAAVFWVTRADTGHIWDTPDEMQALQARGIPSLYLKNQSYAVDDGVRAELLDFFETVK